MRRERCSVVAAEPVGPYTLLRVDRGGLDPGIPGQFFMLEAPRRVLPRPMSVCLAAAGELAFLIDPIGPGTRSLCELERGERLYVLGPLGNGFDLDVERPLLVGGGIGIAPLPYLSQELNGPPAILGFRSELHAEAAVLLPGAEVCIEPTYVTALLPEERHDVLACGPEPMLAALQALVPNAEVAIEPTFVTDLLPWDGDVLACGPEPMLEAVRRLRPDAQLAWEAPMACGYGACYGCAVEIDGELKRLCVEGPVLAAAAA